MKIKRSELNTIIKEAIKLKIRKPRPGDRERRILSTLRSVFDEKDHVSGDEKKSGHVIVPTYGQEGLEAKHIDLIKAIEEDHDETGIVGDKIKVLRAILLFTTANVPSVRAPSKFDSSKAGFLAVPSLDNEKDDYWMDYNVEYVPKKEHYEDAKKIMYNLSIAKPFPGQNLKQSPDRGLYNGNIFRGMILPQKLVVDVLQSKTIQLKDISSATIKDSSAKPFMTSSSKNAGLPVFVQITDSPHGTYIGDSSGYQNEYEVVISGKLTVKTFGLVAKRSIGRSPNGLAPLDAAGYARLKRKMFLVSSPGWRTKASMALLSAVKEICNSVPDDLHGCFALAKWISENYDKDTYPLKHATARERFAAKSPGYVYNHLLGDMFHSTRSAIFLDCSLSL